MLFAREEEVMIAALGCAAFILLVILLVAIFFHVTLMKALQACSPRNQTMAPGLVWLRFVPILHLFWGIINAVNVGNSLAKEYRDRGLRSSDESFGKGVGVTYYVLLLIGFFLNLGSRVVIEASRTKELALVLGGVGLILAVVQLVLFIVYWVKIAGFVKELENTRGRSGYADDYDDYGGGRRRSRYDDDYDRDDRGRGGYDDRDDRDDRGHDGRGRSDDSPRDDRGDDDYRRGDDRGYDDRPRDRY